MRFAAADHFGGCAVGLIVIFLGIRVVRDTIVQLMDTMPDAGAMDRIREVASASPAPSASKNVSRARPVSSGTWTCTWKWIPT